MKFSISTLRLMYYIARSVCNYEEKKLSDKFLNHRTRAIKKYEIKLVVRYVNKNICRAVLKTL